MSIRYARQEALWGEEGQAELFMITNKAHDCACFFGNF